MSDVLPEAASKRPSFHTSGFCIVNLGGWCRVLLISLSSAASIQGGVPCVPRLTKTAPFEPMSKRRQGFPSKNQITIGIRNVRGDNVPVDKLSIDQVQGGWRGRNDLCTGGSGKRLNRSLRQCRF
jgi:hypothetical protein